MRLGVARVLRLPEVGKRLKTIPFPKTPLDREYSILIPRIASPPLIRDKNRMR
jgi:hypothetical protein